jgi:LmbE family N-acetylglucosaminyl deacetylase
VKRVLAISTHPDDETLGAGGTLLKHRSLGDEVHWFLSTEAFAPAYSAEQIERQKAYVDRIAEMYGVTSLHWAHLPTTRLADLPMEEIIAPLRKAIDEIKPQWIYTTGSHDVHTDHGVTFAALMTAVKSFNRTAGLERIVTYEVISSTDVYPASRASHFVPNVYSNVTEFIDDKLDIMSVLTDELHPAPLPRSLESIRALARYRGSTIGVPYAEAFMLQFEAY